MKVSERDLTKLQEALVEISQTQLKARAIEVRAVVVGCYHVVSTKALMCDVYGVSSYTCTLQRKCSFVKK